MLLKNKVAKNASWIVGCKVAQSVIAIIIGMLTARYLGPSNFGVINYAASMVAFVTPIMQLGLNNILVQELVNSPEKEGTIIGSSIAMNLVSALLCYIGIFVTVSVLNAGEKDTLIVCCLYGLILFFQAAELTQYWFQAHYISKYSSLAIFIAYILTASYQIIILIVGKSIYWFAVSQVLNGLFLALFFYCMYRRKGGLVLSFSFRIAKRLLKRSCYYIISGLMVVIFIQTDKIMIKNMLDNEKTGYYAAAMACAGMTSFVFGAIIDSFRPLIFEKRKKSVESSEQYNSVLYGIIGYFALFQSLVMALLAPILVRILYGASYEPAAAALQIAVWYATFSYMGGAHSVWILAENKQKYLFVMNASGVICNVCLNFILIPHWGICGAAIASVITQFVTNVCMLYLIKPLRPCCRIVLRGMNPFFLAKMLHLKR